MNISITGPGVYFSFPLFGMQIAISQTAVALLAVTILILTAAFIVTRKIEKRPGKMQVVVEKLVTMLYDLVESTMGKHNLKFAPYIGALFLSSLFGSLIGMTQIFRSTTMGTVDSLKFDCVGFEIDINGVDYSNTSKCVYRSIKGAGNVYTASLLGSNYIYTRTITGLPNTGTITFTVRPFIRIGDVENGIDYYGQEYTITYVNGVVQR